MMGLCAKALRQASQRGTEGPDSSEKQVAGAGTGFHRAGREPWGAASSSTRLSACL